MAIQPKMNVFKKTGAVRRPAPGTMPRPPQRREPGPRGANTKRCPNPEPLRRASGWRMTNQHHECPLRQGLTAFRFVFWSASGNPSGNSSRAPTRAAVCAACRVIRRSQIQSGESSRRRNQCTIGWSKNRGTRRRAACPPAVERRLAPNYELAHDLMVDDFDLAALHGPDADGEVATAMSPFSSKITGLEAPTYWMSRHPG